MRGANFWYNEAMTKISFSTKTAIVLASGLLPWQELNVTAFLSSAIANQFPETMGKDFEDASGVNYLGIFRQPVMIFQASPQELKSLYQKARKRGLSIGIYTREIFRTQGDENLETVAEFREGEHDYVGLVIYGKKSPVDKVLKSIKLHK